MTVDHSSSIWQEMHALGAGIIAGKEREEYLPTSRKPVFWHKDRFHSMEFNLNERSDVEETASLQADFEPVIDRKRGSIN